MGANSQFWYGLGVKYGGGVVGGSDEMHAILTHNFEGRPIWIRGSGVRAGLQAGGGANLVFCALYSPKPVVPPMKLPLEFGWDIAAKIGVDWGTVIKNTRKIPKVTKIYGLIKKIAMSDTVTGTLLESMFRLSPSELEQLKLALNDVLVGFKPDGTTKVLVIPLYGEGLSIGLFGTMTSYTIKKI